jgi:hypothetical protein
VACIFNTSIIMKEKDLNNEAAEMGKMIAQTAQAD